MMPDQAPPAGQLPDDRYELIKSLIDRGQHEEAIEQLEVVASEPEWRERAIEFAKRIANDAIVAPRGLRHLLRRLGISAVADGNRSSSTERTYPTRRGGSGSRGGRSGRIETRFEVPESFDIEEAEKEAGGATEVERTPHLDIVSKGEILPGSSFSARVYLDRRAPDAGERTENVRASAGSRVSMTFVVSDHFCLDGPTTTSFILDPSVDRIDVGSFDVQVVNAADQIEGRAFATATFYVDGRPCGSVARDISISGVPAFEAGEPIAPMPDAAKERSSSALVVGPNGLRRADITVTIVAPENPDWRSFQCTVETAYPETTGPRKTASWNLNNATRELVGGFMKRFAAQQPGSRQLIAELTGAGHDLFNAAPQIFREVFWALIDAARPIRTIAIVSAEPFIPWELMVPNRDEDLERSPLGVDYQIARWTDFGGRSPGRQISLSDSFVIAPTYPPRKALRHSPEEAAMVLRHYPGDLIAPADFDNIDIRLGKEARTLVHFICHGEDDPSGIQSILLDAAWPMSSNAVLGMPDMAKMFRTKRPVIFLNACKLGQALPSLVGLGGFVANFIKLGATAVIAPLWSVDDSVALEVATQFYDVLKADRTVSFAKILSDIRAKAYVRGFGRDTYAAYCFYGDPFASMS